MAVSVLALLLATRAAAEVPVGSGSSRLAVVPRSFLEMREANLTRQGWDISCGAASLSTLLTYEFGDPYSEATIALSILANTDPQKIRARGGFSLLDLKRFSNAVGYQATGYSGMTLEDLTSAGQPAIVPIRIRRFDHFVVFRRQLGTRVELGDPAFGNMIVSRSRFQQLWSSGIAFFVTPNDQTGHRPSRASIAELGISDLRAVYRFNLSKRLRPIHHVVSQLP